MSSVISSTVRYFVTLCQSVLPDDSFVFFGKRMSVFTAPLTLQVNGWTGEQAPAELSPQARREEIFTINSALTYLAGGSGDDLDFVLSVEDTVMANWALITTAVGNDYRLGNNVRWAQVGKYDYVPDRDASSGMQIGTLDFGIDCQQRIDSLD